MARKDNVATQQVLRGAPRSTCVWLQPLSCCALSTALIFQFPLLSSLITGIGIIKVLLTASFEELRFYFYLVDFGDGDASRLEECLVAYVAVEHDLFLLHVLSVYMSKDGDVLRTVFQGERDGEGVTVRAGEHAVLGNEFKTRVLLQKSELSVYCDFHKNRANL